MAEAPTIVVIKSTGEGVGEIPLVSGAAILSDGRVGLVVNVEGIVSLIVEMKHRSFEAALFKDF